MKIIDARINKIMIPIDGEMVRVKVSIQITLDTDTIVRFSFRHGTYSVERPGLPITDRLNRVIHDARGKPLVGKPTKHSGLSLAQMKNKFSKEFVQLVEAGCAVALVNG